MTSCDAHPHVQEGVTFQSPVDGTKMLLTPEKSIELQVSAGADPMGLLLVRIAEAEAADGLTRSDLHCVVDFSCLKIGLLDPPDRLYWLQNQIGADIMMALDDVCPSTTVGPRVQEAMERSIRWLDRCIGAHKRPAEQNLFGIIQGKKGQDAMACVRLHIS